MAVMLKQIKPDADSVLMGLEKEDMSVFPGCSSSFEIPWVNNKPNIGLEGKENKALKDKFESFFGIKFDTPEGLEWLSNYSIDISHDVTAYDIKNTKDAWDLHLLKVNGGMGIVATSDVAIEESPVNTYKFILADENLEVEERVRKKETKLAAMSHLSKMYESNTNRLILVAKYLFNVSSGIGTNKVLAFDKMHDFIEQSTNNCTAFLSAVKTEPSHLELVVKVREAIYRNIIRMHNSQFVLYSTQTPLGRNEEEVIKFLGNPANQDILGLGLPDDSPTSVSAQLKQYLDN